MYELQTILGLGEENEYCEDKGVLVKKFINWLILIKKIKMDIFIFVNFPSLAM